MVIERRTSPSWAERARTAVASASVAALTTYPRHGRPSITSVAVRDDGGRLELSLPQDSEAARTLLVRPAVTVRLASSRTEVTTVQGLVRRPAAQDRPGGRFVLEPAAVRVGADGGRVVATDDYWTAEPDPLRECVADVLAHLSGEHADALAHCLHAQGRVGVRWVEPVGLDRYGLDLTVVDDDGVDLVRLAFPAPVRCLEELAPHLYLPLRGRCGRCRRA